MERVHYLIKLAIELILVTNEITLFILIKISSEVIESVEHAIESKYGWLLEVVNKD